MTVEKDLPQEVVAHPATANGRDGEASDVRRRVSLLRRDDDVSRFPTGSPRREREEAVLLCGGILSPTDLERMLTPRARLRRHDRRSSSKVPVRLEHVPSRVYHLESMAFVYKLVHGRKPVRRSRHFFERNLEHQSKYAITRMKKPCVTLACC